MSLTESQHYELWANYYAGEAVLLQCDATIHVEAFDDVVFWEKIFIYYLPTKKFNFKWASNSPKGIETSGCEQCLKYKNYLNNRFFICIDSDYRYLLQETDLNPSKFIFQTYTYSVENHFCYAKKLNAISEKCTGIEDTIFDFEVFLADYSAALYEAFIWHLYFIKNGDNETFSKSEFSNILSLNGMQGFSIKNNGEAILNELTKRSNTKVEKLKLNFNLFDLTTEKTSFSKLGLNRDNAYLYVRGHNLFDLIVKIGNELNNQLLSFESNRLIQKKSISKLYAQVTPFKLELERILIFHGYNEIEIIGNEIVSLSLT